MIIEKISAKRVSNFFELGKTMAELEYAHKGYRGDCILLLDDITDVSPIVNNILINAETISENKNLEICGIVFPWFIVMRDFGRVINFVSFNNKSREERVKKI